MGHSVYGRNHFQEVPQGSVLGPLLFNAFINDLFLLVEETEVCCYADDTTIYVCGHELQHIASSLETDAQKLSKWFLDSSMKMNPEKCHLLIFGEKNTDVSVHTDPTIIRESVEEKRLAVTQDKHLDFKNQVNSLCKKLDRSCVHFYVFQTMWMLRI